MMAVAAASRFGTWIYDKMMREMREMRGVMAEDKPEPE